MASEERTFIFGAFLAAHQKNFVCAPDYSLLIIILISVIHTSFKSSQYYLCKFKLFLLVYKYHFGVIGLAY